MFSCQCPAYGNYLFLDLSATICGTGGIPTFQDKLRTTNRPTLINIEEMTAKSSRRPSKAPVARLFLNLERSDSCLWASDKTARCQQHVIGVLWLLPVIEGIQLEHEQCTNSCDRHAATKSARAA